MKRKRFRLIDVAVPLSSNMQSTFIEKKRKYEELAIQTKRMWKTENAEIIPIIISSTGLVHVELQNNIKKLGLKEHVIRNICKKLS
jgi:ribosomal protein L28